MSIRQTLLNALRQYRGDNLERARLAFANCTPEQMDSQYGESGQTRRQILAGYEEHTIECEAARLYVERLPEN
jgi:hypothetical protein